MKKSLLACMMLALFALILKANAATLYVDINSAAPAVPYSDWANAATNIQDAIDASSGGDIIMVTNGVYTSGGRVMAGDLTNRVALYKAVIVQSVNGPFSTTIQGAGATNGLSAVRCAWLTNGASLIGFTLQGGATRTSGDPLTLTQGGGLWCASSSAMVQNCVIISNTATAQAAGAYQGTLRNCVVTGNKHQSGSGATMYNCNMASCTVVSNVNAGVVLGSFTNCVIYYNSAGDHPSGGTFTYCCTTPTVPGIGNINSAPKLLSDGIHLAVDSPCVAAGTNLVSGADLFGESWDNPPSIGCSEIPLLPFVISPVARVTGIPPGFTIGNSTIAGEPPFTYAWLKDGVPLVQNSHFISTQSSNLVAVGVSLADAGAYQVMVSNDSGSTTSSVVNVIVHCVDAASGNPVPPYLGWATAAINIQDAIDAAAPNDIVLVTNGLYATGGRMIGGTLTNRVTVDKPLLLQSVNGPQNTIIQGAKDSGMTNGPAASRCVWLTTNAALSGFTLRGGAIPQYNPRSPASGNGGGVIGFTNSFVYNCLIQSNSAVNEGAGAAAVTMDHCTVSSNIGGNYGAGVAESILSNCIITNNITSHEAGGVYKCDSRNCLILWNRSSSGGGGAEYGSLVSCTVAYNTVNITASASGGVANASLTNCIVFGNVRMGASGTTNYLNSTLSYCDSDPLPAGLGNIDVNPQFVGDGFHLPATSPCVGVGVAGINTGTDIDDQNWSSPPSMGCDELATGPLILPQTGFIVGIPSHGLTLNVISLGQEPFNVTWFHDGVPVVQDATHVYLGASNLVLKNFGPEAAGHYDILITNAFGAASSPVADVVIHAVDAASSNPMAPFLSWETAATNIQDAIDAASGGDIVLVTNGVYSTGGKVIAGDLTNRVALDKQVAVVSANGYASTVIEGMRDPSGTNGPTGVRGAYVSDGAVLSGFTICNGATRNTGDATTLQNGGGVWCTSTNALVSNCVLSNNVAANGGGFSYGTLINSYITSNLAAYGAGEYRGILANCTVVGNSGTTVFVSHGCGVYDCRVFNSIVRANFTSSLSFQEDNYGTSPFFQPSPTAAYSDIISSPPLSGSGNITSAPQYLDSFHIAYLSPCRAAGSAAYSTGVDIDGEPWSDPPSMGCDEVILENLVGPMSVTASNDPPPALDAHPFFVYGNYTGVALRTEWSWGDGTTSTNAGLRVAHFWYVPGDYTVKFTVYNNDYTDGISTNLFVHVTLPDAVQLFSPSVQGNTFTFQYVPQPLAFYFLQYATNLTPPVIWIAVPGGVINRAATNTVIDPYATNWPRFYRIIAQ